MNRVKEFRKELGISQLELAKDIGVSRQTINMIENDKYNPTLELCLNLARSLQTDLNSLFWEDDFLKKGANKWKKKLSLTNSSNAHTAFLAPWRTQTARGRSYRESGLYRSLLSHDIWQPHPLCPCL